LQINESFPFELNWPSAPFNTFYVYYYMLHLLQLADVISPSKDLTLNIKDFLICGEQLNFLQYMKIVLFLI